MVLYAIDDVDDAYRVTRAFLGDLDRWGWVKLALVVFFVGTPGFGTFQANVPFGGGGGGGTGSPFPDPPGDVMLPDLGGPELAVIAGVALLVLGFGFVVAFVAAVLEFVFVASLRDGAVRIRAYWREHWRRGVRLFGFRLVVGFVVVLAVLLVSALVVLPALGGETGAAVAALVLLLPVLLVLGLLAALVDGFTTAFVVPIMLLEERTVLGGWRRLWGSIRDSWKQYLAYAIAAFVLATVGALLVGLAVAIGALVLLVPFGVLFGLGVVLLSTVEPLGIAVLVLSGLAYALTVVVLTALVQAPVGTYLRYYALLVLGDVAPDLDIIPERRDAARTVADE